MTVGGDSPVGWYDVWAVTAAGVSNFRSFVVGDWPEAGERGANGGPGQAQRVALPVVVNGRVAAGPDADHFVFRAMKGQRAAPARGPPMGCVPRSAHGPG